MELIKLLQNISFTSKPDQKFKNVDIKNITVDSRLAKRGDLFVCIKGLTIDSHDFVKDLDCSGVAVIIAQNDSALKLEEINCAQIIFVDDTRSTLSTLASNFFGNPTKNLKIHAITGTNGKTSTAHFLSKSLELLTNKKCGNIGTTGIFIGEELLDIPFKTSTTPDPIELQQIFKEMQNQGVENVVMEVSSHSLALKKLDGVTFETAIFTNLTQDHLDFHKTFEEYFLAKSKLFYHTKTSVINIDDPYGRKLLEIATKYSQKTQTYSINEKSNFKAEIVSTNQSGSIFNVVINEKSHQFNFSVPGLFSIYNIVSVITTLYSLGFELENIKSTITKLHGVNGRIQKVENNKNLNVFIDYAHSPDGLKNIIDSVAEFTSGKLITVFGCGGDRDKTKRPIMGEIATSKSQIVIITSDNPRNEIPEEIINQVASGIINVSCKVYKITDRKQAIQKAISLAQKDDSVIIAGKGHENYQQFQNNKRIHFDDYQIAQETIDNLN